MSGRAIVERYAEGLAANDSAVIGECLHPDYVGRYPDVELDHAQDILADLIGAVVTALRPNFRLAKLEGDAAFMYMTGEKLDGAMLLDTIEHC